MAKKAKKDQTVEELIEGLRSRYGHMPTRASEAARKKREKEENQK